MMKAKLEQISSNGHTVEVKENTSLSDLATDKQEKPQRECQRSVSLDDFYSDATENNCIYIWTRESWSNTAVDARIRPIGTGRYKKNGNEIVIPASEYLAQNRSIESKTWAPGLPMIIENRLVSNGGLFEHPGVKTFNLYQPPTIEPGDPKKATLWIDLVHRVYPNNANHMLDCFAHRIQRPGEKINHALVLGGSPGIGKDTMLEPLRRAVGAWNFNDVTPAQFMGRFNGFFKSVFLRVSEARDMGDVDRYSFYEHEKIYTAAPPEVIRIDEKNRREYGIMNVCFVVITTNHKAGGIYLPADDRRHYVAWSECTKDDFNEAYWRELWNWYDNGGFEHIAAYLQCRNLDNFDPKAPPKKTPAFWEIVDAGRAPEDAEMADTLDLLDNPDAVTIEMVSEMATGDFLDWITERKNRRQIPHRFETAGYVPVRNDGAKDGLWKIGGKRAVIYAKKDLSTRDRIMTANRLIKEESF